MGRPCESNSQDLWMSSLGGLPVVGVLGVSFDEFGGIVIKDEEHVNIVGDLRRCFGSLGAVVTLWYILILRI